MGGRGNGGARNAGNNVEFSVESSSIWGTEQITSYEEFHNPTGIEDAVNEMKREVQRVLELAEGNVDRAYDYLADAYPLHIYGDEATKIIDNRDEHNIIAVDVRINDWNGKIHVTLTPTEYDESDFNTREELDAMGLYERRR